MKVLRIGLVVSAMLLGLVGVGANAQIAPAWGVGGDITCTDYLAPKISMVVGMQISQWLLGYWSALDTMRTMEKKPTVGAVGQNSVLQTRELKKICSEHPEYRMDAAALHVWTHLLIGEGKTW